MLAITDFMLPLIYHKICNVLVNRNYGTYSVTRLRCFASDNVTEGSSVQIANDVFITVTRQSVCYREKLEEIDWRRWK